VVTAVYGFPVHVITSGDTSSQCGQWVLAVLVDSVLFHVHWWSVADSASRLEHHYLAPFMYVSIGCARERTPWTCGLTGGARGTWACNE
jgi:hypothetical protein